MWLALSARCLPPGFSSAHGPRAMGWSPTSSAPLSGESAWRFSLSLLHAPAYMFSLPEKKKKNRTK